MAACGCLERALGAALASDPNGAGDLALPSQIGRPSVGNFHDFS